MAKIEIGRFSDLLRRLLSMSGVSTVASELAPEISPVFVLEQERPEWEFLKNAKLCTSQFSVTPVAAQFPQARLRNPPGSGIVAVFTDFNWAVGLTSVVNLWRVTTLLDMAGPANTMSRDTRLAALNISGLIATQQTSAVALTGDFFYHAVNNAGEDTMPIKVPFVLTPGFAIDIGGETVNSSLRGNFHWLERRLGALEVG